MAEVSDREMQIREQYIEELVQLQARIGDDGASEATLERRRADAACKRAADSEAERDSYRKQRDELLEAVDGLVRHCRALEDAYDLDTPDDCNCPPCEFQRSVTKSAAVAQRIREEGQR